MSKVKTNGTTAGDWTMDVCNAAALTADVVTAVTSGGVGVGVTLAFNTIGWAAQNVLFNTIDAIIGDPAIANAFGGNTGANATASITHSTVTASGAIGVTAEHATGLEATVGNGTTATAAAATHLA